MDKAQIEAEIQNLEIEIQECYNKIDKLKTRLNNG